MREYIRRLLPTVTMLGTLACTSTQVIAQARPQCAEGLNITVTGRIDRSQKMSRNWLFETDIRHPAPACRVTAIILRGNAPPEQCVAGRTITASGTTTVSEGSFPGAQITTSSVTCK